MFQVSFYKLRTEIHSFRKKDTLTDELFGAVENKDTSIAQFVGIHIPKWPDQNWQSFESRWCFFYFAVECLCEEALAQTEDCVTLHSFLDLFHF